MCVSLDQPYLAGHAKAAFNINVSQDLSYDIHKIILLLLLFCQPRENNNFVAYATPLYQLDCFSDHVYKRESILRVVFAVYLKQLRELSRKVVVGYKRNYAHEVLINCLFKLAQENSGLVN